MKTLVISDVHANLTALQAVLAAAGEFDRVWCLGDLVGYGPDANDCIRLIQSLPNLTCAMGNHDAAMMGFIDLNAFNHEAREAIRTQAPSSVGRLNPAHLCIGCAAAFDDTGRGRLDAGAAVTACAVRLEPRNA